MCEGEYLLSMSTAVVAAASSGLVILPVIPKRAINLRKLAHVQRAMSVCAHSDACVLQPNQHVSLAFSGR